MSKHLSHKPRVPFHWDGHAPAAKPEPRACQVCVALVAEIARLRAMLAPHVVAQSPEPEGWDIDGLGR